MLRVPPWLPLTELGVIVAALATLLVVRWLDRRRDWGAQRRSRLLLGLPWGTITSATIVLGVYLFVQGGLDHWFAPLVVPYRAWSYLYPLGVIVAPFAHSGVNHLTGNLLGTVVLGTLAEYAWGHFPTARGAHSFGDWRTNPYVRAFVLFPLGVLGVGLLTGLFAWGPVVGFSGVVFAFAGFALVRYPIGTVVALTADDVLGVFVRALRNPVTVAQAEPSFGRPWWAGIAIQGHLLGLILGLGIGAAVLGRRERSPSRLFIGVLFVAVSLSLWAIWWFRGGSRFVLYRGIGVILVLALALMVTISVGATQVERSIPALGLSARQLGLLVLVLPALVVGAVAVPLNLTTVADDSTPGEGAAITVRDYTVAYAENVTNQQTSIVNVSAFGETTAVRASGVIVVSGERHIWAQVVSRSRLAFAGRLSVPLGGPGWRESVFVSRTGWDVAGGGAAYMVFLRQAGDERRQLAYLSPARTADPVLAGHRVAFDPQVDGFFLEVSQNGSAVGSVPIPTGNETESVAGITFRRFDDSIVAIVNDTRVRIAVKETYRGG